ncbi:MAG: hypothetical protein WCI74_12025 [Actinomycetes bacterium]
MRSVSSQAIVAATVEQTWGQITNVEIANYPLPKAFRLAGIPHPLRAEIVSEGIGGERIAYFDSGKRFIQRITAWNPPHHYAFTFNPETGFKVLFLFDLSDGIVMIPSGSYVLESDDRTAGTAIQLVTEYSIDRRFSFLIGFAVRSALRMYQRYLLTSITANANHGDGQSR